MIRSLLMGTLLALSGCSDEKGGGGGGSENQEPRSEQTHIDQQAPGFSGSTARFTVMDDRLYAITTGGIKAFTLEDPKQPKKSGFAAVDVGIETLFNDGKTLFVGAADALYVYSMEDPDKPKRESRVSHARTCDPVVVQDEIAYVTLRSGGSCPGDQNNLIVYDVSDLKKPKELSELELEDPEGLGIDGDRLFVCDGAKGLRELDVSNPKDPQLKDRIEKDICRDVVVTEDILFSTGAAGITQYDLSTDTLDQLSQIKIEE